MKNYIKPEVKITILDNKDALMVSGGLNTAAFTVNTNGSGYNKINF